MYWAYYIFIYENCCEVHGKLCVEICDYAKKVCWIKAVRICSFGPFPHRISDKLRKESVN